VKRVTKRRIGFAAAAIAILCVVVVIVIRLWQAQQVKTFSGIIANRSLDCNVDGLCSITVQGKTIVTGCGLVADDSICPNQTFSLFTEGDTKDGTLKERFSVGTKVQVTAQKTPNSDLYNLHCPGCGISAVNK